MPETGSFTCSDPLIERLHENVRWSMRGNFVSVPTDCPQRDERLGWTGDLQVFAPTAAFYDRAGDLGPVLRGYETAHAWVDGCRRLCVSDTQTAYALALCFDLLPAEQRKHAGDRLSELVRDGEFRIGTGFAGTPLILDALTVTGHLEEAYRLLLSQQCPSWLDPVTMGATTVWERWDSMLPDGSINPGNMTSFNHYALGAVADWLHRTVAGLAPAAPGYRTIHVRPRPGGGLTSAGARHRTPYGLAAVEWRPTTRPCTSTSPCRRAATSSSNYPAGNRSPSAPDGTPSPANTGPPRPPGRYWLRRPADVFALTVSGAVAPPGVPAPARRYLVVTDHRREIVGWESAPRSRRSTPTPTWPALTPWLGRSSPTSPTSGHC
ncbi:alpha-L-rhamnosidase C-terminal domain-containing protein [Actinoplanes campanulatus]|nr:alpha-L-rhamnosidase C-terminal domain-containing protein [Actinoplanes campanulatus]